MADKYWVGNALQPTGLDYEEANNWNPGGVPADGDNIFFDSTANTTCKISDARQVDNITIENNFDQLLEFDNSSAILSCDSLVIKATGKIKASAAGKIKFLSGGTSGVFVQFNHADMASAPLGMFNTSTSRSNMTFDFSGVSAGTVIKLENGVYPNITLVGTGNNSSFSPTAVTAAGTNTYPTTDILDFLTDSDTSIIPATKNQADLGKIFRIHGNLYAQCADFNWGNTTLEIQPQDTNGSKVPYNGAYSASGNFRFGTTGKIFKAKYNHLRIAGNIGKYFEMDAGAILSANKLTILPDARFYGPDTTVNKGAEIQCVELPTILGDWNFAQIAEGIYRSRSNPPPYQEYHSILANNLGSNGQVLAIASDGSLEWSSSAGGGSDITVKDEGSTVGAVATTLNFVGNGVVASGSGATKTITITDTDTNTNQLTEFTLAGDSGSSQTIGHGNTVTIAGGTNITSVASATDTITLNVDDAFLKNDADDETTGTLTAAGFAAGTSGVTTTNGPADFQRSHASDPTMTVEQDGTGDIAVFKGASNELLTIRRAGSLKFSLSQAGGVTDENIMSYRDVGGSERNFLSISGVDTDANGSLDKSTIVIHNRGPDGDVEIRANTSTAGSSGEVSVAQFEDSIINLKVPTTLTSTASDQFKINYDADDKFALHVGTDRAKFRFANTGGTLKDVMTFKENGTGVPRIGINQNSPSTMLHVGGNIKMESSAPILYVGTTASNSSQAELKLHGARSADGNPFGQIVFSNNDDSGTNTGTYEAAKIFAFNDGEDKGGGLQFQTVPAGSSTTLATALTIQEDTNIVTANNLTVGGNLIVSGDSITVNAETITTEEAMLSLGIGQTATDADALDFGFYGTYDVSDTQKYRGIFADASDSGKFKLFKDLEAEPTTTVNVSGTGYAVGTLVANLEGNVTGNVTGNVSGSAGSATGNAASATALETARNIGGVSFDGTADINLPGVNIGGNQDTSGNADTATLASTVTITDNNETDETVYPVFVDGATGTQGLETETKLSYKPDTGILTSTGFAGALTGDVTGNVSGTAATVTGAAQPNITSVGTLTSLAVSGDLTVDSTTLKVDSTNDRVGIGVTSPDAKLRIHQTDGSVHGLKVSRNDSSTSTPLVFLLDDNALVDNPTLHVRNDRADQFGMAALFEGRVGIGHSGNVVGSPDQQLHIEGSILVDAYNQGTTTLASDYTTGDTELVLTDASTFNEKGTGTIDGVEFEWTGITYSTNTLTVADLGTGYTAGVTVAADTGLFFREGFENDKQPSITIYDNANSGASRDDLSINANSAIRMQLADNSELKLSNDRLSLTPANEGAAAIFAFRGRPDMGLKSNTSFSVGMMAPDNVYINIDSNNNNVDNTAFIVAKNSNAVGSGTELFRVAENGNVGIGTTIPQSLLDVRGAAGSPGTLTLSTAETTVVDGDKLGRIDFNAPSEADGTDAILIGASIWAEADDTFAADNNETELVFATAASGAVSEAMRISSGGDVGIGNEANGGYKLDVQSGTADSIARFKSGDANGRILIQDNDDTVYVGTTSGYGYFGGTSNLGSGANLVIHKTTGNVGLGSTSPSTKLHIADDTTSLFTGLLVENEGSAGDSATVAGIEIKNSAGTDSSTHIEQDAFGQTMMYTGQGSKNRFLLVSSDASTFTVDGDLKLGGNDIIASDGTTAITTSGADVTVAGNLTCTGLNLQNGTLDYGNGKQQSLDLAVGWYTFAVVKGRDALGNVAKQRAFGEFLINDLDSSRHGSCRLNATHFFGNGNSIQVFAYNFFGTAVFNELRIKRSGTYSGAALQVYVSNANNNLESFMTMTEQSLSWVLLDTWIADTDTSGHDALLGFDNTGAGGVDNSFADFTAAETVDLSVFAPTTQGGIYTSGGVKAETLFLGKTGTSGSYRLHPDSANSFIAANADGSDITLAADDDLLLHADDDIFFQAGGATKMALLNDGQLDFADGGSIQLANGTGASPASDHVRLSEESDALRIDTEHGYIRLGPLNSSFSHIITDREKFYFNKEVLVDTGNFGSHNDDLNIRRARSNDERILIQDNSMTITSAGNDVIKIDGTNARVGIGTTSPGNILDVEQSVDGNAQIRIENKNSGGTSNQASVGIVSDGNNLSIASYGDSHATLANYNRITTSASSAVISIDSGTVGQGILVADGGNVGIGTTSPEQALQVEGNIRIHGGSGGKGAQLDFGDDFRIIKYTTNDTLLMSGPEDVVITIDNNNSTNSNFFAIGNNDKEEGDTNFNELFRVQEDGKVGIGTTSPQANLHISGGTGDGILIIEADTDNSGESDQPFIVFEQDGGTQHSAIGSHSGSSTDNNALIFSNSVGSSGVEAGMIFKTGETSGYANATERMRITPAGNVGIGTNSPDRLFEIKEGGTGAAIMRLRNSNTSYPNDTAFGSIEFYNADSSGAGVTAKINAISDASGRGGQLQFQTDDTGTSPQTALLLQGDLQAKFFNTVKMGEFTATDGTGYAGSVAPDTKNNGTSSGDALLRIAGRSTAQPGIIQLAQFDANNFFGGTTQFELGRIQFAMNENSNEVTTVADIRGVTSSPNTPGHFDGAIEFFTSQGDASGANLTEKMIITADGNVGINETAPSHKLDVNGSIRASGNIVSTSQSSFNTMAQYYYQRTSMGTGAVDLRVPVGGAGTANPNFYPMPRAGKIMALTVVYYGGSITTTSGSDTFRIRKFSSGTETTSDVAIARTSLTNLQGNSHTRTIELSTPLTFDANDGIFIKRQVSGGNVIHVAITLYMAFDA